MALARRVPIVLESLDFRRKRAELETSMSPRYARMLSGLAYAQIGGMIRARAMRLGVRVIERCNLTILSEPGQEDLAAFLAAEVVPA